MTEHPLMNRLRHCGRRGWRLATLLLSLVAPALIAGCHADNGTLLVLNRTSVPLVLEQFGYTDSTLVVDACSERTIAWNRVWGGQGDSGNWPYEPVPAGAYAIPLPGEWLRIPMEQGNVRARLVVTADGIGVAQDNFTPFELVSGGSFPPDPGAERCAGAPPPMSSSSPEASPPP
jgi:hypothetical protein